MLVGLMMVAAVFALQFGGLAEAQAVAVDYTKAHLTWDEPVVAGAIPTSYKVKCGTATGTYTLSKTYLIAPPLTTASGIIPIGDLVTVPGTYFCVASALNVIGESANSTEITFQAGRIPPVPSNPAITPN